MKVRVLRPALEDLAFARKFYDRQTAGVGDYFFDSLFAEIDSLTLHGGIHSPTGFTTGSLQVKRSSFVCLIAAAIQNGFEQRSRVKASEAVERLFAVDEALGISVGSGYNGEQPA